VAELRIIFLQTAGGKWCCFRFMKLLRLTKHLF